jgi:hypothetical protein
VVEGVVIDTPFRFEQIDDSIGGTLLGSKQIEGDYRRQTVYTIKAEDEKQYAVYGTADLNGRMKKVRNGAYVRITYVGDEAIEGRSDLNPRRIFKVETAKVQSGATGEKRGPRRV